jgi:hypothetical protein
MYIVNQMKGNTMNTNVNDSADDGEEQEPETRVCWSCDNDINLEDDEHITGRIAGDGQVLARRVNRDRDYSTLIYCVDCFTYCEDCDSAAYCDSTINIYVGGWSNRTVCSYCYDDYVTCASCNEVRHSDDTIYQDEGDYYDSHLCESCHDSHQEEMESNLVHNYSWNPSPRLFWFVPSDSEEHSHLSVDFSGIKALPDLDYYANNRYTYPDVVKHGRDLFMGFELETNNTGDRSSLRDAAEYLVSESGCDGNYLYLKEDASISGFEIVTHPATLEAHKLLFPRQAIKGLTDRGLQSWRSVDGTGAGLHVHVSKASFSHSHLHKFQMFHYNNATWLKKFAGRDSGRWASFDRTSSQYGNPVKLSDLAKGTYHHASLARYHALNFVPHNTVELRYFRGSLLPETVLAVLEMVHAIWTYTRDHDSKSYRENGFAWSNFRSWVNNQPYEFLTTTLDRRGA